MLGELLSLTQSPRRGRDQEQRVPAGAECGVGDGADDMHAGDAAVGRPGLDAVVATDGVSRCCGDSNVSYGLSYTGSYG